MYFLNVSKFTGHAREATPARPSRNPQPILGSGWLTVLFVLLAIVNLITVQAAPSPASRSSSGSKLVEFSTTIAISHAAAESNLTLHRRLEGQPPDAELDEMLQQERDLEQDGANIVPEEEIPDEDNQEVEPKPVDDEESQPINWEELEDGEQLEKEKPQPIDWNQADDDEQLDTPERIDRDKVEEDEQLEKPQPIDWDNTNDEQIEKPQPIEWENPDDEQLEKPKPIHWENPDGEQIERPQPIEWEKPEDEQLEKLQPIDLKKTDGNEQLEKTRPIDWDSADDEKLPEPEKQPEQAEQPEPLKLPEEKKQKEPENERKKPDHQKQEEDGDDDDDDNKGLGLGLGLGVGIPTVIAGLLADWKWGAELFQHLRHNVGDAAKLFNLPNANLETLSRTLDNLSRGPLPPIDAFGPSASVPLGPGQLANLPAGSAIQLASGSISTLALEAGGTATLPIGAVIQSGVDIEVIATEAGTAVTNIGEAAANLGMSMPSSMIGGLLHLGSMAASIATNAGGTLTSTLLDGEPVLKLDPIPEEMQGDPSEGKTIPESWDALKEAVQQDQAQDVERAKKGKQPDRPENDYKKHEPERGDLWELRKYHAEKLTQLKRAEIERELLERQNQKLDDEIAKTGDKTKYLQKKLDEQLFRSKEMAETYSKNLDDLKESSRLAEMYKKKLGDAENEVQRKKNELTGKVNDLKLQEERVDDFKKKIEKVKEQGDKWTEMEQRFEKELMEKKQEVQEREKKAKASEKTDAAWLKVIEKEYAGWEKDARARKRKLGKEKNRLKHQKQVVEELKESIEESKQKNMELGEREESLREENAARKQKTQVRKKQAVNLETEATTLKIKGKQVDLRRELAKKQYEKAVRKNEANAREWSRINTMLEEMNKQLASSSNLVNLAKKSLFAARAQVDERCRAWFDPNRCGETSLCQSHPKGGELCWHPGQDQKAKQCWMPKAFSKVMGDSGLCPIVKACPPPPKAPGCEAPSSPKAPIGAQPPTPPGGYTLSDVLKGLKGCQLRTQCPAGLPSQDYARCMVSYNCPIKLDHVAALNVMVTEIPPELAEGQETDPMPDAEDQEIGPEPALEYDEREREGMNENVADGEIASPPSETEIQPDDLSGEAVPQDVEEEEEEVDAVEEAMPDAEDGAEHEQPDVVDAAEDQESEEVNADEGQEPAATEALETEAVVDEVADGEPVVIEE